MLLTTAKMLFKHADGRRIVSANPCASIELTALLGKRPSIKRRLMLSTAKLSALFAADLNRENLLTVKVLIGSARLGTAVRSGELRTAKWNQFDFGQDIWKVPTSKTGPGIKIPLTAPVKSWLLELNKLSAGSSHVVPVRGDYKNATASGVRPINPNTIGAAIEFWIIEQKPKVRRFTLHDLRSTAKGHMRALGVPSDILEMCLNHRLPGIEGIYDVHTYFDEHKQALTVW